MFELDRFVPTGAELGRIPALDAVDLSLGGRDPEPASTVTAARGLLQVGGKLVGLVGQVLGDRSRMDAQG